MFNKLKDNLRRPRGQGNDAPASSHSQQQTAGQDDQDNLSVLEQTASQSCDAHKWDDAEEAHDAIVEIKESSLGATHPSTLNSKTELGYVLRQLSRYEDAEDIDGDVLESWKEKRSGDADVNLDLDIAKAMNNLALDIKGQGGFEDAVRLEEEAMEIFRRVEGEKGVGTLTAMNNLGNTYRSLGRFEESVGMHEVVVRGKEEVLGPRHRETVMGMDTLGMGLREVEGRIEEGCKVQEEAVRIGKEEWGEEDEMVVKCLVNLAGTYGRLGGHGARAIEMLERAVDGVKRSKGEESSDAMDYMNNLGVAYAREGRWEEAERVLGKVWEWNRKARGENHFKTKGAKQSLEVVLQEQGKLVWTNPVDVS